jgi:phospholipase C
LSTVDTVNEVFPGNARYPSGPYGLGMRVPMIVISPWTKGGWVNSQVFDHTSLIRFIERRFSSECGGLREPNITPWRRAVVGDLTSAFDFHKPDTTVVSLPSTISYEPPDAEVYPDYRPVPPAVGTLPKQEPGVRPARALPYELDVVGKLEAQDGSLQLRFGNSGLAAAVFQVRSGEGDAGPWTYTVGAHEHTRDSWALKANGQHFYDLAVHGPNGFFRSFKGALGRRAANLAVRCFYDGPGLTLEIKNQGSVLSRFSISDAYNAHSDSHVLTPGRTWVWHWCLDASHGWYDLTIRVDSDAAFERKLAGHVEDGRPSTSDPALGAG